MQPEGALLEAVLADPADDAPRLIYADWLDEHGDGARAEFIRVQCALPRLTVSDDRYWELQARERQLLWANGKHWAGPLRRLVKRWHFRRGLVEAVTLRADAFLRQADTLFRVAPIRDVRLLAADGLIPDLGRCPQLSRLRGLDLRHHGSLDVRALLPLLRSPHLTGLRSLGLRGTGVCTNAGWRALAAEPVLSHVTALDLSDHQRPPGTGTALEERLSRMGAAAEAWYRGQYMTGISATGMRALVESPYLANVRSLTLTGYGCQIHREAMECLLSSTFLGRLTELDLRNKFTAWRPLLHRLTLTPQARGLRTLILRNASQRWRRQEDARFVEPEPIGDSLSGLVTLDLDGEWDWEDFGPTFVTKRWPNLTTLRLRRSWVRANFPDLLGEGDAFPALTLLDIRQSRPVERTTPPCFTVRGKLLPQLRCFLGPIGEEGVEYLATSPDASRLAYLDLNDQELDDEALASLACSAHLSRLTSLIVWHNNIGAGGVSALVRSDNLPALSYVDLRGNPLTPDAMAALRGRYGYGARYGPARLLRRPRDEWEEAWPEDDEDEANREPPDWPAQAPREQAG
jgi:uncharacterized protein (TIGR02996 family)